MEDEYKLLMPFLDESESFCHGYECGKIMEQMKTKQVIYTSIHEANIKQIEMIAELQNYYVEFKLIGDGWANFNATPKDNQAIQAPKS